MTRCSLSVATDVYHPHYDSLSTDGEQRATDSFTELFKPGYRVVQRYFRLQRPQSLT
jgi:hypothetical protein